MITEPVLIDTGPLVALLHRQDEHHARCTLQATHLVGPVYTSWLVVTEAAWLLRSLSGGLQKLLQLLIERDIRCLHIDVDAVPRIAAIARQFEDLSPQLADLSLLYLAERHAVKAIFTLDRRDFSVYRKMAGDSLRLLPETI